MFSPLMKDGCFFGYTAENARHFFFFGSRSTPRALLPQLFPKYEFSFLRQVHGCAVVEADPTQTFAADAHYTSRPGIAVVVQSADCIPLLLASENQVCAVHAGWKGAALNIVNAVHSILPEFAPLQGWIGPHIRQPSFQVGQTVANQLLAAAPKDTPPLVKPCPDSDKVLFDLTSLLRAQLAASFSKLVAVQICPDDTVLSPQFHSFRRDRERAERQFSFVVIKP